MNRRGFLAGLVATVAASRLFGRSAPAAAPINPEYDAAKWEVPSYVSEPPIPWRASQCDFIITDYEIVMNRPWRGCDPAFERAMAKVRTGRSMAASGRRSCRR